MYELVRNQILKIETITTPKQTAVVKTGLYTVYGYDLDEVITFESIPEKQELGDMISELHFIDGDLVWIYKEKPLPQDQLRIQALENELLLLSGVI